MKSRAASASPSRPSRLTARTPEPAPGSVTLRHASVGAGTAAVCPKAGGGDYILTARVPRLGPGVRGALGREGRKRQLREGEEYLKPLIEEAVDVIAVVDAEGGV